VRSFFALLNTRSHSIDIAGQDKISRVESELESTIGGSEAYINHRWSRKMR
jgi:hypothetical protein